MNIQEYELVKGMSYEEYCNYLDKKYFNSDKIGLFKHHTFENVKPNLSNPEFAKDATEEEKNTITYCSFDEHLFLHILIGEQTDARKALGIGGAVNYIIPQLHKYFNMGIMDYSEIYYNNLDKSVFDTLVNRCNEDLSKINIALDHNQTVYLQAENYLNTENKALVIIGTGLGKTTTALEYLWKNKCRALVIGPNNLIKNGWEEYSDWCDTTTYQAFANSYYNIDYSKYGVVILDEAHHIGYDEETEKGAKVWSEGIRYLFDNNIKVLGLTATPERSDKIDISKTFFKGCVCEGFAVEDGIENGIIHPFSYITAYYDTNGILDQYSDCENKELVGQLDLAINNTPTVKEIFKKHMPNNKRKGIVFIQEIDDEAEVISIMKDVYPNVEMRIIHSKMNQEEIEDNRNWFENTDEGYLLAVNMISEGAHYKCVNTLIMFRRTNSYLVFTQQLGRIITLTKNENPNAIVFDLVNNIENVQYGNNNTKLKNKHSISKIIKVLRQSESFKSNQIIVADETRDIVKNIRKIKEYEDIHWTEDEDSIIRKYYPTEGYRTYLRLNNRSASATIGRASFLNILSECNNRYNQWTEEEDQIIKNFYKTEKKNIVNRLPNRSYDNIVQRACRLGIYSNKLDWTEEEINIIKNNYAKYGPIYCANILKTKSVGQCQRKGAKLGLKFNGCSLNNKWTEEENKILIENYSNNGPDYCEKYINRNRGSIIAQAKTLGLKFNRYKKDIICVENNMVFHSLKDAQQYAKTGSVCSVLDKNDRTAGGYHWCSLEKYNKENYVVKEKDKPSNAIKLHCIETDEIFYSVNEASNKTGLSNYVIKQILDRKTDRKYQFTFEYVEEENKNDKTTGN